MLELYGRLKEQFEAGLAPPLEPSPRDEKREGKALGVRTSALLGRASAPAAAPARGGGSSGGGTAAGDSSARPGAIPSAR